MLDKQQKQIVEILQEKIYRYLKSFKKELSLPEYKFVCDTVLGILKSKSIIVNRIVMVLDENISIKKTAERLYRNLKNTELIGKLYDKILRKQCRKVSRESVIIIDDSDIIKSCAKKMEGLKIVRDGSKDSCGLGYDIMNIIAVNPEQESYQIVPLSSDLIARDIESDSVSQILEDRLIDITIHTGNKATYLFDRGYDSRNLISFLKDNGNSFIIRSTGRRGLIINSKEQAFKDIVKDVELNLQLPDRKSGRLLDCGIKKVSIRVEPHPKKDPEKVELWLVVAQHHVNKKKKKGYFYFFCDFPGQNLSEDEIITKTINSYPLRWKIEEVHKHIKQEYNWEDMQLMSYVGLKNMNLLLLLSMCYLYSLKEMVVKITDAFPTIMKYTDKKWKEIFNFVYYRLSVVLKTCLTRIRRYNIITYNWRDKDSEQLYIAGL